MTAKEKLQKSEIKIGKYTAGVPFISNSYKKLTPKGIKIAGESCLFAGAAMAIIAGSMATPPGWLIIAGGLLGLAGRHIAKAFSE